MSDDVVNFSIKPKKCTTRNNYYLGNVWKPSKQHGIKWTKVFDQYLALKGNKFKIAILLCEDDNSLTVVGLFEHLSMSNEDFKLEYIWAIRNP